MRVTRIAAAGAMLALGALLFTAAGCGGSGSNESATPTTTTKTTGGTLHVNVSDTDVQSIDPAIDYENVGWAIEYATCLKLVNYPDKAGSAGTQLVPDAATAMPTVTDGGKTYRFTIRPGLAFNTGEKVTAATFAHVINRDLTPALQSPAVSFLSDVVGADAVASGKAKTASGVTANGDELTIRLTREAPDLVARLAMPFFCAVPLKLPATPQEKAMPSAGPYYISSRTPNRQVTLKRNPHYGGTRPQNSDLIALTTNTNQAQSLLQVRAGQADYDLGGLPPASISSLQKEFGVNKERFFVHTAPVVYYAALNMRRLDLATRKAINYAIDRRALARQAGALAGTPTDQILPPTINGYRDALIYPVDRPNVARAKQLLGDRHPTLNIYTQAGQTGEAQAQVIKANLKAIGVDSTVKALPFATLNRAIGNPKEPYDIALTGWFADYPDPVDFVNILLDGANIHDQNNVNVALMDVPAFNTRMRKAALLSGKERYQTYGTLDVDIMRDVAPWAATYNGNTREFVSDRLGCYIYQPAQGVLDLAAACIE